MKRIPELRALSEDHHHGLVLARRAKQAAAGTGDLTVDEVWARARETFETELEPHFRIEESTIGTALTGRGEDELTRRLLDDHAALRAFFAPGAARTADDLGHFGELLERHIRFEERELFEVAQETLSPEELAEVAAACRAKDGPRGS